MNISPCKDCKDRNVTANYNCHSHCEKYKEYSNQMGTVRKQRLKTVDEEQALYESRRAVRRITESLERRERERHKSKGW